MRECMSWYEISRWGNHPEILHRHKYTPLLPSRLLYFSYKMRTKATGIKRGALIFSSALQSKHLQLLSMCIMKLWFCNTFRLHGQSVVRQQKHTGQSKKLLLAIFICKGLKMPETFWYITFTCPVWKTATLFNRYTKNGPMLWPAQVTSPWTACTPPHSSGG